MKLGRIVILLTIIGCGKDPITPFQGDPAKPPERQRQSCELVDGEYRSASQLITFSEKIGQNFVAKGGACIARPLREVWAVSHNPLSFKWKDSDLKEEPRRVESPRALFEFEAKYEAGPFLLRKNWTIHWLQTLLEGTLDQPKRVIVAYERYDGFIPHWKGAILLEALAEGVTSFEMENEIRGFGVKQEHASGAIEDYLHNLRSLAPTWSYLR